MYSLLQKNIVRLEKLKNMAIVAKMNLLTESSFITDQKRKTEEQFCVLKERLHFIKNCLGSSNVDKVLKCNKLLIVLKTDLKLFGEKLKVLDKFIKE